MDLHREPVVALMPRTKFSTRRGNLPSVDEDWQGGASGPRFLVTPWAWLVWLFLFVAALSLVSCSSGIASPAPLPRCRPEAKNAKGGDLNLPGVGGGNWTDPKDDAARVNAAGGGKRPAARDGGDAASAGMAGETRGAAGPAHPLLSTLDSLDARLRWGAERVAFWEGAAQVDALARLHRREVRR
jgi:hypothetical protein